MCYKLDIAEAAKRVNLEQVEDDRIINTVKSYRGLMTEVGNPGGWGPMRASSFQLACSFT